MLYTVATLLALSGSLVAADCNADNCLRALRATQTPGRLEAAQSFCATFTKPGVVATPVPSFVSGACVANQVGNAKFRISSACSCIGTASTTAPPTPTVTLQACGIVSSLSSAFKVVSPSATPIVPAQIAHDCLNSVPLNKEEALKYVDSIKPYLEWQSDTAYLKNPPADQYHYPPHDVFGRIASIESNLKLDLYVNEYAFQKDLFQVFAPAHDGHFVLYPDLIAKALQWGRKMPLVSISKDGVEVPKIYSFIDFTNSPANASEVVTINGLKASEYIEQWANTVSINQDIDANYNNMFASAVSQASGAGVGFFFAKGRVRYLYPGPNTTFTYADGTTRTDENIAQIKGDFTGVTDGPSFYQKFCTVAAPTTRAAFQPAVKAAVNSIPGYPEPVISTIELEMTGYYLEGEGNEDVAVLSVLGFTPLSPADWQSTTEKFFAMAKAAGKTKLVIDLSANGGGYIFLGYDLYRQLFPDIVQTDYNRIRENDAFLAISKAISGAFPKDFNPYTSDDTNLISAWESWFNYRYDVNLTAQPFETFEDKFAPHVWAGDDYTNLMRWNFNDNLTTINTTFGLGIDISGYGSRVNLTQPFAPENVIMLYDGSCASTCTLFSEWMRLDGKVKSVMMGGRPDNRVVQAVGGVKGAQVLGFDDISFYAQGAAQFTQDPEILADLSVLNDYAAKRSAVTAVNFRDQILPGNINDGLPAQFVYEAADCRLYYKAEHINDQSAVWKSAANSAWNGGKCISGAGLSKRDIGSDNRARMTPAEVKRDAAMRNHMVKRMTAEKGTPLFEAKYGKKVIV